MRSRQHEQLEEQNKKKKHQELAEAVLLAQFLLQSLELVSQPLELLPVVPELLVFLLHVLLVVEDFHADLLQANGLHHYALLAVLLVLRQAVGSELCLEVSDLSHKLPCLTSLRRGESGCLLAVLGQPLHQVMFPLPGLTSSRPDALAIAFKQSRLSQAGLGKTVFKQLVVGHFLIKIGCLNTFKQLLCPTPKMTAARHPRPSSKSLFR
ncbi:unnamed protein product [Polarella glacialis]|uniref:Uncharacterized protein n=1 Tax=Polarella glacialis TaxID=89957 RepID=A0A813JEI5_POLGL|nr:unnamed protein product [Polarella glacialis]